MVQININGINREMTAEEQAEYNQIQADYNATRVQEKLNSVKVIRNQKLKETDWWVISEQITDAQKTWRQNLRNIPANHTDEAAYDALLARDSDGNLTNSVWSKP
jgi:hypothetical protein